MDDDTDPYEPGAERDPPPRRRGAGWNWLMVLALLVVTVVLIGLTSPLVLRSSKASERTQAINNARQVGIALVEFDREFGSFPDNGTMEAVAESIGYEHGSSGNNSNDYFRQLVAFGVQSEEIFFAKTAYTHEPDGIIRGSRALAPGEVGFGYVMLDATTGQNTSGNPGRPVLATPLLDARTDWSFDPGPHHGRAVVLRLDGSASVLPIRDHDQRVSVGKGRTMGENGDETVWGTGVNPVIKAPDKGPR